MELELQPSEPIPDRVVRAANDYYPTPDEAVLPILQHLPPATRVLDPACGEGDLLRHFQSAKTFGIELDEARIAGAQRWCNVLKHEDALAPTSEWPEFDLCVGNPPFTHGLAFLERAISMRKPRATVAFLLRLTFLESRERRAFHQQNPSDVYVLSKRPPFRPGRDGKMSTDSVTCAWFVFGPGRGGRWSVL